MGMGVRASLMSSLITNAVNMVATFGAIFTVDRYVFLLCNVTCEVHVCWCNKYSVSVVDSAALSGRQMLPSCDGEGMLSSANICRFGRKPLFLLCGTTMAIMQVILQHPHHSSLSGKHASFKACALWQQASCHSVRSDETMPRQPYDHPDALPRSRLPIIAGKLKVVLQAQVATGALTKVTFTGASIPETAGTVMIFFICVFVACFAASWGPLGWLVNSPFCDTVVCSAYALCGSLSQL